MQSIWLHLVLMVSDPKFLVEIFTKSQSRLSSFGFSFSSLLCCFPLEKDKGNQITLNFPLCSPKTPPPQKKKERTTLKQSHSLYHQHPTHMPLLFILSLFIRFSASVQSQTSQPLSWVKRRKWAFGPDGTVYKELVRFQQCFEVSSTQETVCH